MFKPPPNKFCTYFPLQLQLFSLLALFSVAQDLLLTQVKVLYKSVGYFELYEHVAGFIFTLSDNIIYIQVTGKPTMVAKLKAQ